MAARAGAVIADPEFVQFHPTAINVGKDPAPLATEALRGEGCTLVNDAGERFMLGIDPAGELAPRDIVARGIFREVMAGRGAWLDCREAVGEAFAEHFPTVYDYCRAAGIDPAREMIPVVPAAHYHMGGILTDAEGRSSLDGLWAAGEVTSTGAHGANRLASNSLLEAVVFAARVADDVAGLVPEPRSSAWVDRGGEEEAVEPEGDSLSMKRLRAAMSAYMGVIRNADGMRACLREIAALERMNRAPRFANVLATAKIMTAAALSREESRGGHFREDFPEESDAWKRRTYMTLARANAIAREAGAEETVQ